MPTPESAAFLAKKPTVPPTYEGVDYEDNVAVHNARDAIIREQWVRSMMSRLVGEELGKCYAREGVNHLEKCGKLRGMFLPIWFLFFSFFFRSPSVLVPGLLDLSCYSALYGLSGVVYITRKRWLIVSFLCAEKYFELLSERKIKGYLFEEKNYFSKST